MHFQKFVDKVIERCTGTSYPAINSTDLSNINITIPSLAEQTQIGNFLTAVDTRLSLLKQKLELLKSYKKGIMAQIFNQELRFKDENGQEFPAWEEKTLGEVFKLTRGKVLSMKEVVNFKDNLNLYPVYSSQTQKNGLAEFLTAIDKKINLTEQQIVQSEEWKKGLLQAMLV